VGGTHARFATLGSTPHELDRIETLSCADFARIEHAFHSYLQTHGIETVEEVCLAAAGPITQDLVDLPNSHWTFSRRELEATLKAPVMVINDFTAQALSLDVLEAHEFNWFRAPRPVEAGTRTILGPGTGLGVAVRTPGGEIIASEGGHVGFAPANEHEIEILRMLLPRYRRVSVERLLSGPGLENLFWANRQMVSPDPEAVKPTPSAREIEALAGQGDELALRSVRDFFDILATFAGDMALSNWSTGGVFISGGVVRKLSRFLDVERFRARFEDKGRFTRFCETVPVAGIDHPFPGLLGCAAGLEGSRSLSE
jgi:glucokinase